MVQKSKTAQSWQRHTTQREKFLNSNLKGQHSCFDPLREGEEDTVTFYLSELVDSGVGGSMDHGVKNLGWTNKVNKGKAGRDIVKHPHKGGPSGKIVGRKIERRSNTKTHKA